MIIIVVFGIFITLNYKHSLSYFIHGLRYTGNSAAGFTLK